MKKKVILKDLWIIVLDIIAVNLSYYLALLIRFFVNGKFRPSDLENMKELNEAVMDHLLL